MSIARRLGVPALGAGAGSALIALAGLLISRFDGRAVFGTFVTVQSVGMLLAIPLSWGAHVVATNQIARGGADAGATGRAIWTLRRTTLVLGLPAAALALAVSAAVGADPLLWCLCVVAAVATAWTMTIEAVARARGRHDRASGWRLGSGGAYLAVVLATVWLRPGSPALYVAAYILATAAVGLGIGWPRGSDQTSPGDADAALGPVWVGGQLLLTVVFSVDLVALAVLQGPAAAGLYALVVTSSRRVIGILFSDSLASMVLAEVSKVDVLRAGSWILRQILPFLALATVGFVVAGGAGLVLGGGTLSQEWPLVLLGAACCAVHALVIVLFSAITAQPSLGLVALRRLLAWLTLPGIALQWFAAAWWGPIGLAAAFGTVSLVIAGYCLNLVARRLSALAAS